MLVICLVVDQYQWSQAQSGGVGLVGAVRVAMWDRSVIVGGVVREVAVMVVV